jgi:protein ImuB
MFAALHLPAFKTDAALRASHEARGHPCAVVPTGTDPSDPKAKLPLLGVDRRAQDLGLAPGWQLNRALVRCPGLRVLFPNPSHENQLQRELVDLAEAITPDLEITAPGLLLLDISRTPRRKLFLLEESEIAHAELWHVRAPTPDLAHLAVLHEESQGGLLDPIYFAGLPLDFLNRLPGLPESLPLLKLWGLRTLGDFMNLSRQDLADRLGPAVGNAHDILHGKTCRLLRLHRPAVSLGQSFDFEEPVHLIEPLLFTAKRLLHTLCSRVEANYQAISQLDITLLLESEKIHRNIRLPEPLSDPVQLLRPLHTYLENLHLPAPVSGIDLNATATDPRPAQREWFTRRMPDPTRWSDTLAQLEALVGKENFGVPLPETTHRPDAFKLIQPLSSSQTSPPHPHIGQSLPSLPLHRFRPPRPVAIAAETLHGIAIPKAILTGTHTGEIRNTRGPFPLSGDWWQPNSSWRRLEWDIELSSHQLLRLAHLPSSGWQLEGIYS